MLTQEPRSRLWQNWAALRGATAGRLLFRSVQQWNGAYWRYALAAIAAEQITMVQAVIHCDMIMQLAELEKMEKRPPYLAFLYDELLRKQIEKRVQKRDPNINLTDIFSTLDKQLVAVAKQRLSSALKLAGIAIKEPHQEVRRCNSSRRRWIEQAALWQVSRCLGCVEMVGAPHREVSLRPSLKRPSGHFPSASSPRKPGGRITSTSGGAIQVTRRVAKERSTAAETSQKATLRFLSRQCYQMCWLLFRAPLKYLIVLAHALIFLAI